MKKENSTNLKKYSEMDLKETELVQLIRQLKDYVILDKKDYEKLVQNSKPIENDKSVLDAKNVQIALLEKQLAHQEDWANYWKNKHKACLDELKKETSKWWRFL